MIQQPAISFRRSECPQFKLRFQSGHFSTRQALLRLMNELKCLNLSHATCVNIELVLAEIFNNIVRHAYSTDQVGPIFVCGTYFGNEIYFKVEDFGCEMTDTSSMAIKEPKLPRLNDSPAEGGFGWFLISQIADRYRYWRESDKNCIEVFMPASK